MAWRQLPDGSFFNPNTGGLKGFNHDRESAGRALSHLGSVDVSRKAVNPMPPLPSQKFVELPGTAGPEVIIDPKRDVLALNPFELGVGAVSDTTKKLLLVGGILGVATVACLISKR